MKPILIICGLLFCFNGFSQNDGEALFKANCAACHKIKGRLVGPGLANIHKKRSEDWIISFVQSSQSLIKSGDADAIAIYEEYSKIQMPDQNLSNDQVQSIIAYISENSPQEKATDAGSQEDLTETTSEPVREPTEDDILKGENLFVGNMNLANGGPTCNSCHNITYDNVMTGGTLAKDLTEVHARMGNAGVKAILSSPPFPAMKQAYIGSPLTEDEIFQLTAFLNKVNEDKIYQHPRDFGQRMLLSGIIGALILMGIFPALWFRRKSNSVNKRIYDRQAKSLN